MVFVGVSFIDNIGNKIKSEKQNVQNYPRRSTLTKSLDVFGTETTSFSGWMPVVGPVKGSYLVKIGTDDSYDYISDFGLYVQDPCQAFDNKLTINLNPTNRTVKDLKYHDGTDSQFWLPTIC